MPHDMNAIYKSLKHDILVGECLNSVLTTCHMAKMARIKVNLRLNYFWSIKNSNDVLNTFKSTNFQASKLSTYDFSTLYTTLPHHLIKDKLFDLINRTFIRENTQYLACNEECAFFHF